MPRHEPTIQSLVQDFLETGTTAQTLAYYPETEDFYELNLVSGCFEIVREDSMKRRVYGFIIKNLYKNIYTSYVTDFIKQLAFLLPLQIETLSTPWVALLNGRILNVETFEIRERTISDMAFHALKVTDSELAIESCPRFNQFLEEVLVDEHGTPSEPLRILAQEMFGNAILATLEAHVTFFLVGKGSNGKSVLLEVLRSMIGEKFCASLSIEAMTTDKFATYSLLGKKLNIVSEEESKYIRSDKFKALVVGDTIQVQKKFGGHFNWRPTVKHVFATNEMPTFDNLSYALTRRIKFIPFFKTISAQNRDTKLTQKLLEEIGGITKWALEGAKRIRENKFVFSKSKEADQLMYKFKEHLSSSVLFFNERYCHPNDPMEFVLADDLYREYMEWVKARGKKQQSFYTFVRDIEEGCELTKISHTTSFGYNIKSKKELTGLQPVPTF